MKNFFTATAMAVTVLSCNNASEKKETVVQDLQLNTPEEELNKEKSEVADTTGVTAQYAPPKIVKDHQPVDLDRKIVKTADIKLELEKFDDFNSNIHKTVKQYGAYIASEQQQNTHYELQNTITIKVPVDRFEDMVNSFGGSGIKVLERTISSEDVSAQYVDSRSRMEARKQVRARYIELLKDAKKMSDVLSIQDEINSTQEEIEAAAGRMQLLSQQSSYSTINLTYLQYLKGEPASQPTYFSKIAEALQNGFHVVGNVLLVFITLWPLLIVAFIIYLIAKRYRPSKIKA